MIRFPFSFIEILSAPPTIRSYGMDFGIILIRSETIGGSPVWPGLRIRSIREKTGLARNNKRREAAF
jgi:hypothetical protein